MFESAARHQSFSAAAEELFITASAVSHQVKALERYLGLSLFKRTRRKVTLTPVGEKYYTSVKQSMNELEVATQRLVDSPETDIVSLSVAPNFLMRWLMPRMHGFQQRYPDVELQISASPGMINFNTGDVDMAISFGHGDWHELETHFLSHVFLVPVCSPRLLDEGPLESPEDLRNHPLIHVTKRLYEWPEWLELAGIKNKGFGRGLHLSSSSLATAAARQCLGVALADSILSADEIEQGMLHKPFDIQLDTHKSFYLVYQKGRPVTYGMQAFKDWVIDEMKN